MQIINRRKSHKLASGGMCWWCQAHNGLLRPTNKAEACGGKICMRQKAITKCGNQTESNWEQHFSSNVFLVQLVSEILLNNLASWVNALRGRSLSDRLQKKSPAVNSTVFWNRNLSFPQTERTSKILLLTWVINKSQASSLRHFVIVGRHGKKQEVVLLDRACRDKLTGSQST